MFRSILTRALATFLVLVTLSVGLNAGTPLIIPHQGRLLDAADAPLNGPYTITYSIFEVPTGGSPLWTESHVGIVVADGLFSVQLGSVVPLTADILTGSGGSGSPVSRYLEIQLAGQSPISPRTQLGSSPYSVAASRVSGDILTSKGLAEIRDFSSLTDDAVVISSNPNGNSVTMRSLNGLPPGTPVIGALSMATSQSSSSLDIGDLDGDGLYQVLATADSVSREITFTDNGPGGIALMKAKEKANRTKCSSNLRATGPSTTSEIDESCDLTRATMKAITTKPTGANGIVRMDAGDSAEVSTSYDLDGNGNSESGTSSSSSSSGTMQMQYKKGLNAVNVKRAISSMTDDVTAVQLIEADIDGDGVMENTCASSSGDASSSVAVSSRFGSGPRQTTSMDGSFSHAHMRCDSDSDGDGVQDNSVVSESSVSGASLRVISLNGLPPGVPVVDNIALTANGTSSSVALKKGVAQVGLGVVGGAVPGASVLSSRCLSASGLDTASTEQSSDGFGAAMRAINTKGTGSNFRVAMAANDSGSVGTDCDDDADGFSERATWTSSNPGIARSVVAADVDGDGDFDNLATQTCDATSSRMESSSASGSGLGAKSASLTVSATPGGSACRAIATKGTGATLRCTSSADSAKAAMFLDSDDDGDGVAEVSAEMDVNPDSASFRLNGLPPGVPVTGTISMTASPSGVHMAVGAATCDGTNWVNASDRNAKENFEKIDGEDILEKISGLEITKWNYKGDDDAQHIGPTAQDFKKTFGVGADDKSISTIDPSGIALAAIKELNKQNLELKNQNTELKKELDELKRLVNQIASKK